MPMDQSDFELVKKIRAAIREGDEATHRLLRQLNERSEDALEVQREMLKAFNRVADNLEYLASAVEGLREDLTPKLDKPPAKLSKDKVATAAAKGRKP